MTENVLLILSALMVVVGAASTVAGMIAPLTKTDADNKVAAALKWVYGMLRRLGLNDSAPALPPKVE